MVPALSAPAAAVPSLASAATGPILPLDHYPGDATGLAFLGQGRFRRVAEPVRLFGGSALVVHPQS